MNANPTPPVVDDALNRGYRTLFQGLAVDVLVAVIVVMYAAVSQDVEWTSAYWSALGLAAGKSAVVAIVSFLARMFVPPARPTRAGGA